LKLSTEFKIGITVIVAIGLAYWGINFMQGNDIFKKERNFYAIYNKVNGLVVSNPVSVNGFAVGLVKDIKFLDSRGDRIIVEFAIKNNNIQIYEDSKFKIFSSDLLGSKGVDIIMGESTVIAQIGDTLEGDIEQDLAEAVNAQIAPLKNKAEELLSKVTDAVVTVESIFDNEAKENLSASFDKIRESFVSFSNTAKNIDAMVALEKPKIDSIFSDFQLIVENIRKNGDNIDTFFSNMADISDSLQQSNLNEAIRNAAVSLDKLSQMIDNVNEGNGTIGKLMYNDSLYNSLVSTSTQLDSLFNDMQAHPKRYIHFSVFGKKDKQVKLSKKDVETIRQSLKE
jgi:phospholipid/cholesterol/gamma-HCH transport system substrate-binding protein